MASPGTASRLNILGVPFLVVYDNGRPVESMPGVGSRDELTRIMARYL